LSVHRLQAGNPNAGRLVVFLRFLIIIALEVFVVVRIRLLAIAMVRFVIEDES
jgi:hypothetical protein